MAVEKITVRQARESVGMTQEDVADKLGIVRQTYAKFEEHPEKATIEQAKRICEVIGAEFGNVVFRAIAR